MAQPLEEFIAQFLVLWNTRDARRIAQCYAEDYEEVDVARSQPQIGRDTVRRTLLYYFRAFPDIVVQQDALVIDGDRAALFWMWTGTHRGSFMNIPPTGHRVRVRGSSIMTVRDGQILRATRIWDLAGLLRDLKLLPELSA
jgi:steroid delta-isomerase-like uncharacterized protein